MVVRFGECAIDLDRMEVRRGGELQPVQPQVFEVIRHLVERRDRVVTKEELLDDVWGDRFVSESTLTSRIKSARKALGDDGEAQAVIRTVHGRGYRFVAEVTIARGARDAAPVAAPAPASLPAVPPAPPGEWPLVGRYELLERIVDAYGRREVAGVVLHGQRGAGATRLAAEAARGWAAQGLPITLLTTTAALAAIPLAALAPLIPADVIEAAGDDSAIAEAALFRRAAAAIVDRSHPADPLIVVVDPGDHLDPLSQAVLARLMADGTVFVLATTRSGRGTHPFAELTGSGRMASIELSALSVADVDALLYRVLAGPIDRTARDRIGQAGAGRPGLLRDIVDCSLATGALTRVDGIWRLTGSLASSHSREWPLVQLGAAARHAAEVLALAGSLSLADAERLLGAAALGELDGAGLLDLTEARDPVVTLADPLQRERIVAALGPVRARGLKSDLIEALLAESHRPADLATAVRWAAELGAHVDAGGALAAASLALQHGDEATAEVLAEHAAHHDPHGAAYAAIVQAELSYGRSQFERAEQLLEGVDRSTVDARTAAFVVRRLAVIRYQFHEEYQESVEWLAQQERAVDGSAAEWIASQRAASLTLLGRVDEALALTEQLAPTARGARAIEVALTAAGAALQQGDFTRCEALLGEAERLLGEQQLAAGIGELPAATLTAVRLQVLVATGRLRTAAELVRPMLGRRVTTYWAAIQGALVELEAGRPRAARELVLPTVASYRANGVPNGLAAALAVQARVCAELGQVAEAAELVDDVVRRLPRLTGAGDWPVTKAVCRAAATIGRAGEFTELALDQATVAARSGAFRTEAELLAVAATTHPRADVAGRVAARVAELAERFGGALWPLIAEHVEGLASGADLEAVAEAYAGLGYAGWAGLARHAGPVSTH